MEICETKQNKRTKKKLGMITSVCGVGLVKLVHQATQEEEEVCSSFCACAVGIIFEWRTYS